MLTIEQKRFRQRGISASDISALCGENPWHHPIHIYDQKTMEPTADEQPTAAQEFGNRVEGMVLDWTADLTDRPIFHNTGPEAVTFQHPDHEVALATPDGLAFETADQVPVDFKQLLIRQETASAVVEVKAPSRTFDHWADPLEVPDGIPPYYLVQVQWQMGVVGVGEALVCALIRQHPWTYRIEFHPAIFEALLQIAQDFWDRHVIERTPPPIDGSDDYAAHLAARYPAHSSDQIVPANPSDEQAARDLREISQKIESLEHDRAYRQNILKDRIGEAAGLKGGFGSIWWKRSKARIAYDKKQMIEWFQSNQPDQLEQFQTTKPGTRAFRPYFKKQGGAP